MGNSELSELAYRREKMEEAAIGREEGEGLLSPRDEEDTGW